LLTAFSYSIFSQGDAFMVILESKLRAVLLHAVAFILAVGASARGDEFALESQKQWHQWRGPLATGVAPQGNPPLQWSETEHVKWKVEVPGAGSASPIVWGDRIILLSAVRTDKQARTSAATEDRPARQNAPQEQGRRRGGRSSAPDTVLWFIRPFPDPCRAAGGRSRSNVRFIRFWEQLT
jgi:outer membrane protein assembly factor BamB